MEKTGQSLIIVSNTSPITNLAAIGQFGLRHEIFGHLHVSQAVLVRHALTSAGET